jgi:hypothetical protein
MIRGFGLWSFATNRAASMLLRTLYFRDGSIAVAESSGRHGRTCFNTGRQGIQPPWILLIDGMTVAIKGKRRAPLHFGTGRHGCGG